MADQKVVILGAKGMLGTDLVQECTQRKINAEAFGLPECDITNQQHLTQAVDGADIIINCASYTNVEKAETEPDLAYQVNAAAVQNLGQLARQAGAWVLHVSTDFVFDGTLDRPYLETDTPNPINVYGKTKLAGEKLLAESNCRHAILRVEWTYGLNGNNFVTKLVELAKSRTSLKIVDDQRGSPTATTEVADVICKLLAAQPDGIFHFASQGYVTRFDIAKFIFDKLKMSVNLAPCKSTEYKTKAQRPLNSRYCCDKIKTLLDEQKIENWQGPLERFLINLKKD